MLMSLAVCCEGEIFNSFVSYDHHKRFFHFMSCGISSEGCARVNAADRIGCAEESTAIMSDFTPTTVRDLL